MTSLSVALFIRDYTRYGGAEHSCFQFHKYLLEQGIDATVYCGKDKEGSENSPSPAVQIIPMARHGRFAKHFSFVRSSRAVLENLGANTVSMAFTDLPGCDIHRSGGLHREFIRKTFKAQPSTAAAVTKFFKRATSPINYYRYLLDDAVYHNDHTRIFLAISHLMADEIISRYPNAQSRIRIIANGVDSTRFSNSARKAEREAGRRELNLSPQTRAIGFCSTNFELKGLAHCLKAFARLSSNTRLLVAGGRRAGRYEALAESLGVADRVAFLGRLDNMPRFYAALDTLCHPTFYDTFGNVVAEALAMGVPVAVSPHAGAACLVAEGTNGYVIDPLNTEKLAQAMQNCLELPPVSASTVKDNQEVFAAYLSLIRVVAAARQQ